MQNVMRRFEKNGVREWKIDDVYERDESSGRVTYRNPDDPSHPFADRTKAQEFIDSINRQIKDRFNHEIRQEQMELIDNARPMLAMIDFLPTYQKLNQLEREVLDEIISPYAVTDASGATIGFNVNLQAAAKQAKGIAKRFEDQQARQAKQAQQPQQKKDQSSGPAMDMTSGAGEPASDEPTNLSEAFAILNKQKKEGKK